MKKIFFCLLLINLLLLLDAGGIKCPPIKTGRPNRVTQASRASHQRLQRKLFRISRLVTPASASKIQAGHPAPFTFQIQRSANLEAETASAFAIQLHGKTFGVTAGHVMENIREAPYVKVENGSNPVVAPIKKFFIGNPNSNGLDLAIFELPQDILPHVTALKPAARAPITGEYLNIPGFANGKSLFVPQQKVLITTPAKLLLQKTVTQGLRGFCGSPILGKNNKVQAIYIGFVNKEILPYLKWLKDLPAQVSASMPAFHMAVPVQALSEMLEMAEADSISKTGTMMYVLGHPVEILHPTEYIQSVELLRRGEKIASVQYNPLIDPGHLEQFFKLEDNDVLRVIVNYANPGGRLPLSKSYDVNVSTGEVTKVLGEDPL